MGAQALERKGDSLDPLQGRVSTAAGSKRGAPASPPRLYLKGKTPLLCLPNTEGLLLPELGPGMAPEDHYRRLVSALSEAGTFEDPQRLYHLGLPGHGMSPLPTHERPPRVLGSPCPERSLLTLKRPWGLWLLTPRLGLDAGLLAPQTSKALVGGQ